MSSFSAVYEWAFLSEVPIFHFIFFKPSDTDNSSYSKCIFQTTVGCWIVKNHKLYNYASTALTLAKWHYHYVIGGRMKKKEKLAYVYQSRLYVKNTCDILFSILRFHKGKKLRAEVEQTISERRRKTEPVSSKERVSSSGLSNKWLAGAYLKIIVYPQYLYYFWFIFVRFKDWVVEFQPTACWKESS